jgi:4Fe-4S ferredoxin
MPMKLRKTENENKQTAERILHTKTYSLTLDKTRCTGCEICMIACPKEAIDVQAAPKEEGEKAQRPIIHIDETKCHFCGICSSICPFGALGLEIDGAPIIPVVNSESFPQLIREIEVDPARCDPRCLDLEDTCPLKLIQVRIETPSREEASGSGLMTRNENVQIAVDIAKEFCPCCKLCEAKFPAGAIRVKKAINGVIGVNREKCPEGCHDCLDVCPIPGVLYLSEDGKVYVNDLHCVFCGACRIVCPEEGALELERTSIRHTPVRSGAWNKALEKLTSTKEMTKELRTKSSTRLRDSVKKRLLPGGEGGA